MWLCFTTKENIIMDVSKTNWFNQVITFRLPNKGERERSQKGQDYIWTFEYDKRSISPPVDLYLNFEKSIWKKSSSTNWIRQTYLHSIFTIVQFEILGLINLICSLFQTEILRTTLGRKIQFKLGKKFSPSNSISQTGKLLKSNADR